MKSSGIANPRAIVNPSAPKIKFRVRTKVQLYQGKAAWHFANLSVRQSRDIKQMFGTPRRGWGSIPVRVTIGATSWKTSLFPEGRTRTYVFAIKASVRKAEEIEAGDVISAVVQV